MGERISQQEETPEREPNQRSASEEKIDATHTGEYDEALSNVTIEQ